MAKRDLKAFMRESAKNDEIITTPGPDTIKDADGNVVMLEIKVLSQLTIQKINENYTKRSIALDKQGNPFVANREVAFSTERDDRRASRHIMVEALVYPDLRDKELMAFYDCHDITEMPLKVFPRPNEFSHVSRAVMAALGIISAPEQEEKETLLEEAKN